MRGGPGSSHRAPILHASALGRLGPDAPRFKPDAAVCVVMASEGYPGAYPKGLRVDGIDSAEAMPSMNVSAARCAWE